MGARLACGLVVEGDNVGAARKLDDDGIRFAVGIVVLGELDSETPGLDPDHGVQLRIEVSRAPENLGRNLILLDRGPWVIQGMFGQITEEFAQGFRAMQGMTVHQLVDLREILLSIGQSGPHDTRLTGV